jgi:formylglycine-generating enzyme required for sulfatase activity
MRTILQKSFLKWSALVALFFASLSGKANNVQVSGITVTGSNITFTLSWENSWNTMGNINPLYPNNWDGVWVFVKYQNNIDNLWKHATLSSVSADHSVTGAGGVLQADAVSDGMGVFIRRTNPGSGNISGATVTLKMGSLIGTGTFNFKVFGTEVVYVPQGDYQLGDGQASGTFYYTPQDITAAKQTSGLAAGALFSGSPAVPAGFPMGYNAFYCMKYEISSEQYVDFLNTLTYDQQAARTALAPNSAMGTNPWGYMVGSHGTAFLVRIQTPGANNTTPAVYGCDLDNDNVFNEANDGQTVAFNGSSKGDFMAFLDWSGLRPMTEMEFEKACRGTQARVSAERAWGSTDVSVRRRNDGLTNGGTVTELPVNNTASDGRINAAVGGSAFGSLRCGIFAQGATGRESSGAAFWGMMEMSGNALEPTVYTDAAGVSFTGNHGNGNLTSAGAADVANWPSATSDVAPYGMGVRGGSWINDQSQAQTSYRMGGLPAARHEAYGGRGIRTAP